MTTEPLVGRLRMTAWAASLPFCWAYTDAAQRAQIAAMTSARAYGTRPGLLALAGQVSSSGPPPSSASTRNVLTLNREAIQYSTRPAAVSAAPPPTARALAAA